MEKGAIGTGHWIFAGVFLLAFIVFMFFAYRKDLKRLKPYYRNVWTVVVLILIIFLLIFLLGKLA